MRLRPPNVWIGGRSGLAPPSQTVPCRSWPGDGSGPATTWATVRGPVKPRSPVCAQYLYVERLRLSHTQGDAVVLTDEIIGALAHFFDAGTGPSHDELDRMIRRAGLEAADPRRGPDGATVGKTKRVREVLSYALDTDRGAGDKLVQSLVGAIKAAGSFRPGSPSYAGEQVIRAAREAFHAAGYELDPEGNLRPSTLDNLEGPELTDAIRAYVRRAQLGSEDAALLIGTGKDLLEATARQALVVATGSYPSSTDFPTTLYQAFDRLSLAVPPSDVAGRLDPDPTRAIDQCLWLLGVSVNKLRNAEGTGHGRPFPARVTAEQGRRAIQSMGLVSQLLLDAMK